MVVRSNAPIAVRSERRTADAVRIGEFRELGERLVAGIEDDDEGAFAGLLPEQPRFHRQNSASRIMIGSGMPSIQSRIPLPIPMTTSLKLIVGR
jgi:hypothetical protein